MLITLEKLEELAAWVASSTTIEAMAVDFETNGLNARTGSRAFIMGLCIDGTNYAYFFQRGTQRDVFWNETLGARERAAMRKLFSNPRIKILAHNAKFEMAFLEVQWDVEVKGPVWCTEVMARLQFNNHFRYDLQSCAERIGSSKHAPMLAWLKKHGPKYHEAPHELVVPYVMQDAWLSWALFIDQRDTFREWDKTEVPARGIVVLEMKTTKNLHKMEAVGLHYDVEYGRRAHAHELSRAVAAKNEFMKLAGVSFVDSEKRLRPVFDAHDIPYGKTAAGNMSKDAKALLPSKDHPIVKAIFEHRDATKRASTYWENLNAIHYNGYIFPSIRQAGAATGRFSIVDPAAQTWPDDFEDPTEYPIRRAFQAPPDCDVVSMDYKGMELRFAIDQVEDHEMAELIRTGADLHQRIADAANVHRNLGKRGRFLRQYGGGAKKMSESLGITMDVAYRICNALDNESPKLKDYSDGLMAAVKKRKSFGYDWMGRRFYFDKGFEYKYPNYWNQGGCSDILRVAIEDITEFLAKNARPETRIVLPIHDELVYHWHRADRHLVEPVRGLMIKAYRIQKSLAMDVSVARGSNFHDLEEVA
jgi:DNA polymerase-1